MKYLIVGLGNMGSEYEHTRHNIGFDTLDAFAEASNAVFEVKRYGDVAQCRLKGHQLVLLKPSTFMNLSGQAVRYWLQQENIPIEQLLVVVDDLSLPLGTLRLKPSGSDGGHNGLKNIQELIGTQKYARLRFGIGNDFPHGAQIHFVLSQFDTDEQTALKPRFAQAVEMIKTFCLSGIQFTMNQFNNK